MTVIVAILVTTVVGAALHAADAGRYHGDGAASLLFVENWWAIVHHQPYFQSFGRPSPFLHLWSLAIEAQFYVVWPLALAAALGTTVATWMLRFVAGLSLWAMARMADITTIDRVYYGTDTRAFGLFLGAAVAFLWGPGRLQSDRAATARRTLDVIAGLALVALVWQFAHRSEFDGWTFPWGLLWVDVLTLAIVVTAVVPGTAIGRFLGFGPMAAVGRRSYSLYLWHWPVIVLLRPGDTALAGSVLTMTRVVLIVGLAELSFRFVEPQRWQPRPGADGGRSTSRGPLSGLSSRPVTAVIVASALVLAVVVSVHATRQPAASAQVLAGADLASASSASGRLTSVASASSTVALRTRRRRRPPGERYRRRRRRHLPRRARTTGTSIRPRSRSSATRSPWGPSPTSSPALPLSPSTPRSAGSSTRRSRSSATSRPGAPYAPRWSSRSATTAPSLVRTCRSSSTAWAGVGWS